MKAPLRSLDRTFAATLLFVLGGFPSGNAHGQDVPFYTIHVQHAGRAVEVRVNGYAVSRAPADMSTLAAQISPFLVDGRNAIELVSTRKGAASRPLTLAVRRRIGGNSEDVASLPPLARDPAGEPVRRSLTLDVDMPVTWSWERAEPLQPRDTDEVTDAIAVVRALHDDLAGGRADAAVDRLEVLYRETGLMRPGVVERLRGVFREWMAQPAWSVTGFPDRPQVEVGDRMVRISAPTPLIESGTVEGMRGRLRIESLYLAKIDGRWVIVRRGP